MLALKELFMQLNKIWLNLRLSQKPSTLWINCLIAFKIISGRVLIVNSSDGNPNPNPIIRNPPDYGLFFIIRNPPILAPTDYGLRII